MRSNNLTVVVNTVRKFRKFLSKLARQGVYNIRLLGSKSEGWFLGVIRGDKVFVVSPSLKTKALAALWSVQKFGTIPPVRALALSVAA